MLTDREVMQMLLDGKQISYNMTEYYCLNDNGTLMVLLSKFKDVIFYGRDLNFTNAYGERINWQEYKEPEEKVDLITALRHFQNGGAVVDENDNSYAMEDTDIASKFALRRESHIFNPDSKWVLK